MVKVNPSIYDETYYLKYCLGSEEFQKTKGKDIHPSIKEVLKNIQVDKTSVILDIGSGRGDISLFLAQKAKKVYGIDYSKFAIKIANNLKRGFSKSIRTKVIFKEMDAIKPNFPDNFFDIVVCIDVLEHLNKIDVDLMMIQISKILKKGGVLFIQTGPNKVLYNFTYKYYIWPINMVLTNFDKLIKHSNYKSLSKDPRTKEEKEQHINEPSYFYLRQLFVKHHFEGTIKIQNGFLKRPNERIRTRVYNFLTTLYPLSKLTPLNLLFGAIFICVLKNKK